MLDFSFAELLLCFVVALVVLGPEKLPGVARAVGRWTGQARVYLRNLSVELERETQARDLRRELAETQRLVKDQGEAAKAAVRKLVTDPSSKPPEGQ